MAWLLGSSARGTPTTVGPSRFHWPPPPTFHCRSPVELFSARRLSMPLRKDVKGFGMPWEDQYGYAQAVGVDDTIYVSGQLRHDGQGNMVGAAPLDDSGELRDDSHMESQMRQT